MRWRNALDVGDTFSTGQVLDKSVGIKKTLQAVRDEYYAARAAGRAVGIGCGLKNSGIGNGVQEWGKARLVVEADRSVSLYNGYTEMGQGLLTVLTQFAVEVTGLPAATFRPKVDTTFALGCGQTTGSRATLFGGRAVISAAQKLRADLDAGLTLSRPGRPRLRRRTSSWTTRHRSGPTCQGEDTHGVRVRHAGVRARRGRARGPGRRGARRRAGP